MPIGSSLRRLSTVIVVLFAFMLAACGTQSESTAPSEPAESEEAPESQAPESAAAEETLQLAYLSFAVANSYDAPMLAAAQTAAANNNAELTVFDANNSPDTQFQQL